MASRKFFFFAILYGLLFAAFGAEVPYVPSLLTADGLVPVQIGALLAAATIAQFSFAPMAGLVADATGAKPVLAVAAIASAAGILLYFVGSGFWALTAIAVVFAMATAPLNPLADALSVAASAGGNAYGRIRGVGSAGFIAGTLASGMLVTRYGISSIIFTAAALFALTATPVPALPPVTASHRRGVPGGIRALVADRRFLRVLIVAGLVIGSHAMSDVFAVITWRTLGIAPAMVAILLALAVGSELFVFLVVGPRLVASFGPAACTALGAVVGCGRWGILAEATTTWVIAASQLLHGLTFALVHLSCMQVVAAVVPRRRFATAQALYGTVSSGLASALVVLASGALYGLWGAHAFWLMSVLCAVAVPFTRRLSACNATDARGSASPTRDAQ